MLNVLKYIIIIVGIIILVLFVFIVGVIFLLRMEDSKTKKHKGKYLNCLRQIFGEDIGASFFVENCDSKSALIRFDNRPNLESYGHPNPNIKPEYIDQYRWHKISNSTYAFINDHMNDSICSFCYDISSRFFRSKMYLDKEEMRKSHFKEILMSQTGWHLPEDAYIIGYIDYSTLQLAPEHIYFCLSGCNLDEIREQLDTLVTTAEGWIKEGNNYHFAKSDGFGMNSISIDYTLGDSFVEVVHFME